MIWVLGCRGMLGSQLCELFQKNKISYTGTGSEVDVTDFSELENFADKLESSSGSKIDFIVNCSAYTAVDKAEDEKESAQKINSAGPFNLARIAEKKGAAIIHISTDYVFDGNAIQPILETEKKSPASVYGKTKASGEDNIISSTQRYYILRTAWLYGFYGKNFVYTMTKAMNSRESVKVVCDQKGTPTNCSTLAQVIFEICSKKTVPYGIYNVTDAGQTTWFEFCREIYSLGTKYGRISNNCAINSCTTDEYPVKAKRPAYSVLDTSKIQSALNIKLPDWKLSLEDFIKDKRFSVK